MRGVTPLITERAKRYGKAADKKRLFAFADAILAIIMTILVLELPKPRTLTWAGIWELKASFLAFAVSFFGLAILWATGTENGRRSDPSQIKRSGVSFRCCFLWRSCHISQACSRGDFSNPVGQILYGVDLMMVTLFNSLCYRSLAAVDANAEIRPVLIARANLLFIDTAVMLLSVVLSIFVLPYFAIIGIVIISVLFVLPIFIKIKKYVIICCRR